ncbi:hypothetical protein V7157_03845 [Neobacillus drentensis]|uniref:hypothetical protein n=1 Tax=Neobacillus drentensis TaxID=220684 RepID=UPI002FFEC58D
MSTKNVNVDELRVQIEAEIRAEMEAESKAKLEAEVSLRKALEEKFKLNEANLEAQIAQEEKNLKKQLDEMPKVFIEIPEDPNNPDDIVPVGWNGIIYAIPRGQQFEVPKVIYEIWRESHKKTQEVNKRIRESVTKEITVL